MPAEKVTGANSSGSGRIGSASTGGTIRTREAALRTSTVVVLVPMTTDWLQPHANSIAANDATWSRWLVRRCDRGMRRITSLKVVPHRNRCAFRLRIQSHGSTLCGMKSESSTAAALPILHYRDGVTAIDLSFPASECPELVEAGAVGIAHVTGKADSSGTRLWLDLKLKATVTAICVRSLDEFELEIEAPAKILATREAHRNEVEWDLDSEDDFSVLLPETQRDLDIGEVLRQALELERPLKPIKPGVDLPAGIELDDVPLPAEVDEEKEEKPVDPRWEALKKLRKP